MLTDSTVSAVIYALRFLFMGTLLRQQQKIDNKLTVQFVYLKLGLVITMILDFVMHNV